MRKSSKTANLASSPIEFNSGGDSPLKANNTMSRKIKEADFNENKKIVNQARDIDEVKD